MTRNLERIFLLGIGIVLALLFYRLYTVLETDLKEVPARLQAGTMVNLNADKPDERMMDLLQKGYYFTDPKDIEFAGATIAWGFTTHPGKIDNIGELNKRSFNVKTEDAFVQGGESYRKRVQVARMLNRKKQILLHCPQPKRLMQANLLLMAWCMM
jgi:hypothetical protein